MQNLAIQNKYKTETSCEHEKIMPFPLTKTIEREVSSLIEQYQASGDKNLLESVMQRNQGLLHSILRRFSYLPDPYEDLLQVANLGLIKAVQRFDAQRGIKFSSYATAIVDGEIRHHLRDSVLMKQPRWLRKLERDIDTASLELRHQLKRNPTIEEIAKKVNINADGVLEILKYSAAAKLHSIDDDLNRENLLEGISTEKIANQHYESFTLPIEDKIAIEEALGTLTILHKKIVYLLFYKELTQAEIAKLLGLNQKKVSRESIKALDRLRAVLNTKIF
jgi:RNA polymerase sigma-B factor